MILLNCLTNVVKAGVAVAVSPAAMVADLCALPSSGYNDTPAFRRTGKLFDAAAKCIDEATKPVSEGAKP